MSTRPQDPSFWAAGLTTNITPTTTNNFNFSYLRTYWAWGSALAPPQLPGLSAGALEIGGESTSALIPYNVNTQSVRTRFWDGQDKTIKDDVTMIKGNHLLSVGGLYERNFDYHQRTDNGQGIMNQLVYQIGSGPGIAYSSAYEPAGLPSSQVGNWTTPVLAGPGHREPAAGSLHAQRPPTDAAGAWELRCSTRASFPRTTFTSPIRGTSSRPSRSATASVTPWKCRRTN